MKKIFLSLVLAVPMMVAAQVFEVTSMTKLDTPKSTDTKVTGISPDGSYILLTSGSSKGLQRFDIDTKQTTTLSTADGAGYNVQVSNDGKEIVYRETYVGKDKLRKNNIIRKNFTTKRVQTIARAQRNSKRMVTSDKLTSVSIQNRLIVLTRNGLTTTLAPNGQNESYIWPSISPDGTKLCYYVAGNGCWVSNIDGSNPQYIAHACRAAQWYDNNTLVAMADEDDGNFTTASAIVAYTLDGKKQVLTDDSMIAMYPYAAKNAIVFSTIEGETYLLNVK